MNYKLEENESEKCQYHLLPGLHLKASNQSIFTLTSPIQFLIATRIVPRTEVTMSILFNSLMPEK